MAENEVAVEEKKNEETGEPQSKKTQSLEADAFHNFLQGKRHILVQDYAHAVESLADACELYVKHYGETAAECGEVYYHYGLALFRLFQQQAGILGDVIPGSEEEEEEEDDEEEEKSDSEGDKEKENTDSNSNENEVEDDDEEDLMDEDEEAKKGETETEASPVPESSNKNNTEPPKSESVITSSCDSSNSDLKKDSAVEDSAPSESATIADADSTTVDTTECQKEQDPNSCNDVSEAGPSTSQPKPKSEDISDLQLAWETLETAKSIFKRQDSKEAQLKVADILIILSEISMELENYVSAVEDLNECLHIRTHCLEPDDRSIAETFYQLALAFTYDSKVQPALENYEKSIEVIKLRIEKLKNQTEVKQTADGFDIDPQVEIDELEGLLPEIQAKMEDTQDMMPDAKKVVKEMSTQKEEEGSLGSTSNKPVSNIGHLLKRKKPEDTEAGKLSEAKKIKLVNAENGNEEPSEMTPTETASPAKA